MTRIKKTNRNRRRDDNRSNRFKEDKNVINKFEKPVREKREYKETRRTYEKPARENIERNNAVESVREDLIIGRNAVMEALKSDKTIEALYVTKGQREGSINAILSLAKENRVVIKEVDKKKLDSMSNGEVHQGAIAVITPYKYFEVKDILDAAKEKGESPFIVILDELEDPHNLGSIIRTSETCGVHGIIIPKRRNVGVTPTVYKSSVGAVEHVKIAKVTNINATIDELKEEGIWVYGADIEGKEYSYEVDFSGPCALIIGSEGRGISQLTLKKCDKLVKIPMIGKINSLNASVAGGIMMYEVLKGRLK
ncbi:MAG: 23S rRNA (guanosine(2251)-2'-O)-methyltransferase RlmB [Clostridium baratii]|uniref:RNA 2'-O ribose methyltransferase substrate binding family protein n=1 Tax=Clostridium baratii str. Sullivan TaxID=1415775 RepID=A0A0A7FU73_9CLOT|nr:23S rRNA (guanosine(2251)-2'-O)-methyltransferase RlmB [Clostridium baratii]AIY83157.1 RNA 2'-O ribose methyltransferase substrate binding family protein [Clostridium baratii str. Sullivan]MBS6008138.1 23S rRNA (guanosine(2251)-2'-O)-methyltransferase RlmB [Clostridium baratii]